MTPGQIIEAVSSEIAQPESVSAVDAFRHDVMRLQDYMLALDKKLNIETDCPVRHLFAPGAYAREMSIPKGTVIIGKIHRHAHLNFISAGKVRVLTEHGPVEMTAPHSFVSEVGTKRIVHALEDTIWTTVHVTDETDLEKIEDHVIAKSYDELGATALENKDST
jgi:hypothetical protein